jgi:hypothetical protein
VFYEVEKKIHGLLGKSADEGFDSLPAPEMGIVLTNA